MFYSNEFCCFLCNLKLGTVFIRCLNCSERNQDTSSLQGSSNTWNESKNICLRCFSTGTERGDHENTHDYKVFDLSKIDSFNNWTVDKELELIDIIEDPKFDIQLSNLSSIETNSNKTRILEALNVNASGSAVQTNLNEFHAHIDTWLKIISNNENNLFNNICANSIDKLVQEFYLYRNSIKNNSKKSDLNNTDENLNGKLVPLRPLEHTSLYRKMNGYRPARGDFETEMNDKFEQKYIGNLDINELNVYENIEDESDIEIDSDSDKNKIKDEETGIKTKLKLSIIDTYIQIIGERYDRKEFIRDFGMLNEVNSNKGVLFNDKIAYLSLQQNWDINSLKRLNEKDLLTRLVLPVKFQRFFYDLDEYLKHVELINYQVYLRKKIEELEEYRMMGLTSLKHTKTYKLLKTKRLNHTPSVFTSSLFTSLNRYGSNDSTQQEIRDQFKEWFSQLVVSEKSLKYENTNTTLKKAILSYQSVCKNNPLKIENYPDYEKLNNEEEKEFCRVARVQPAVFLRVKSILLLECNKAGHCSYSRARKIAGIDVNKTRLIHNLLVNMNTINATPI